MKKSIEVLFEERARQKTAEGRTTEGDKISHPNGELALAAAGYALAQFNRDRGHDWQPSFWPWHSDWWKPTPNDRMRELTKAGALILAEMDRIAPEEKEVEWDGKFIAGYLYHPVDSDEVVVMCSNPRAGMVSFSAVIVRGDPNNPIGYYSEDFIKSSFKPFKGTIIL